MTAILGMNNQFNVSEIKKAYRNKMKEYHPDKFESLGEKLKNIYEAYYYFNEKYDI